MNVETRARQAVDSLRDSVAGLTLGELRVPPRVSHRRVVALAAMAGLLALAGLIAVGDDDRTQVTAGGGFPHLAPSFVPDGFAFEDVSEVPLKDRRDPEASLRLYGRPGKANPFAEADLAVMVVDDVTLVPVGEPVQVRGTEGVVTTNSTPGGRALTWTEGGLSVALISRSLDVDQLVAVAEAMTLSLDDPGLDPGDLPAGLELIAVQEGQGHDFAVPFLAASEGYQLQYLPEEGTDPRNTLLVVVAAADLEVVRWWFAPEMKSVSVRGHDGVLAMSEHIAESISGEVGSPRPADSASRPPSEVRRVERIRTLTLAWNEADGAVVVLVAIGIDEEVLLQVAESIEPLSEDEWSDLTAQAPDRPEMGVPVPMRTPLASGKTDGVEWSVSSFPTGSSGASGGRFCLEVMEGDEQGSSTCDVELPLEAEGTPAAISGAVAVSATRTVVFGRAGPEVTGVRVELDGGSPIDASVVDASGGAFRFYVAVLPAATTATRVVALGARGQEIGRQPVENAPPRTGATAPTPVLPEASALGERAR